MAQALKVQKAKLIEENRNSELPTAIGVKRILHHFADSKEPRSRLIVTLADGSCFELYMADGDLMFLR